jgi:hypothetical protein
MAAYPPLLMAFVQAFAELLPIPNRFGTSQFIVSMLIAHAKGCAPCFNASRDFLLKIGIDDDALDGMCSRPTELPLSDRERHFVEFTLRVARDPSGLKPVDFQEMEALGFLQGRDSRDDRSSRILEHGHYGDQRDRRRTLGG